MNSVDKSTEADLSISYLNPNPIPKFLTGANSSSSASARPKFPKVFERKWLAQTPFERDLSHPNSASKINTSSNTQADARQQEEHLEMGYMFFFKKAGLCKLVGRFNPFSKISSSDLDHFPQKIGVEIPKNGGIKPPPRFQASKKKCQQFPGFLGVSVNLPLRYGPPNRKGALFLVDGWLTFQDESWLVYRGFPYFMAWLSRYPIK